MEPTPEFTRQGEWVAVFYDQGFFIGQVTLVENPGTAHVSFLENTKSHRDYFRWLRVEDVANVDSQYVFRWDVEVLPASSIIPPYGRHHASSVDSLRSQVAKGNNWNEELEAKFTACQKQCREVGARLASREATIESLEARLASQQKECERKIEEREVERQQDQYVARMLEDKSRNGRGRKPGKGLNSVMVKR
ncbi:hypothetical protein ACOMHN_034371 [Nucella lapillus]